MEMINISGLISISQQKNDGSNNLPPEIKSLQVDDTKEREITISYSAIDANNTILRHFIYLNGKKKEITNDVFPGTENHFIYTIKNLELNTSYRIFIEVSDGLETFKSDLLEASTPEYVVYGVYVDEKNSNPKTSVTYIEDAIGIEPANSTSLNGWADKWPFNKIRIVGLKNGQVTKEIKKEDKTLYVDGTAVPNNVSVMVEFPTIYWKFTPVETGGYELRISNLKVDDQYCCKAHTRNNHKEEHIYIASYLCSNTTSLSTRKATPIQNSFDYLKEFCERLGDRYHMTPYYCYEMIHILYIIAYKNLNSQQALGMGLSSGGTAYQTGMTDKKGWIYGSQNSKEQICFLGLEDIYGNCSEFANGIKIDDGFNVYMCVNNSTFKDESTWQKVGKLDQRINYQDYGRFAHASNDFGFIPKAFGGASNTTYYCDLCRVYQNKILRIGNDTKSNDYNGMFAYLFDIAKTNESRYNSCRLCYI